MFDRRLIQNFDWILLILLICIASISVLNLYSATSAIRSSGGSQIFLRQIYWFLIGFGVLLLMSSLDYHVLERFAYPVYFACIGLLIVVFTFSAASYSRV